jgi:DNA-binding transcriptional ArsR family regulator
MDVQSATEAFAALAQPTRLTAFRKLIAAHPAGLAAGEIARLCAVPHNTMSTHLAVLARARLVTWRKQSRVVIYGADLEGFRKLVLFLTRDCCNGCPEICAPVLAELADPCCAPSELT